MRHHKKLVINQQQQQLYAFCCCRLLGGLCRPLRRWLNPRSWLCARRDPVSPSAGTDCFLPIRRASFWWRNFHYWGGRTVLKTYGVWELISLGRWFPAIRHWHDSVSFSKIVQFFPSIWSQLKMCGYFRKKDEIRFAAWAIFNWYTMIPAWEEHVP